MSRKADHRKTAQYSHCQVHAVKGLTCRQALHQGTMANPACITTRFSNCWKEANNSLNTSPYTQLNMNSLFPSKGRTENFPLDGSPSDDCRWLAVFSTRSMTQNTIKFYNVSGNLISLGDGHCRKDSIQCLQICAGSSRRSRANQQRNTPADLFRCGSSQNYSTTLKVWWASAWLAYCHYFHLWVSCPTIKYTCRPATK